jgi:hypothetical protein
VQQYIARPYLIGGKKFDIRIYVLVTSFEPLVAYQFEYGIVRFCTEDYDVSDTSSKTAHLTNYSLNKDAEGFVANQDVDRDGEGSKWSHAALYKVRSILKYILKNHLRSSSNQIHCNMTRLFTHFTSNIIITVCALIRTVHPYSTLLRQGVMQARCSTLFMTWLSRL